MSSTAGIESRAMLTSSRLYSSKQITIVCPDSSQSSSKSFTFRIPEVLAKRASSCLRATCGPFTPRKLSLAVLLGIPQKEPPITKSSLLELMKIFVEWLYTSYLATDNHDIDYYALWHFAERMGAPEFQNAVVNAFAACTSFRCEHDWIGDDTNIQACWEQYDFNEDPQVMAEDEDENGDLKYPKVVYDNKKRLMFTLACAVHRGMADQDVERILEGGGASSSPADETIRSSC